MSIGLREATVDDANVLHVWRNDPDTRQNSIHSKPIPFDEHLTWLLCIISETHRFSYIAHEDRTDIGTVVLDLRSSMKEKSSSPNRNLPGHGRVSITVAPICRGQGYATPILQAVCQQAKVLGVRTLEAVVKVTNGASLSAFRACGFWVSYKTNELWTLDYRL
jgi:UDP-2,4-diacetamido-2,4,6-trideoxy-beta-L-altropyranose hydrolase